MNDQDWYDIYYYGPEYEPVRLTDWEWIKIFIENKALIKRVYKNKIIDLKEQIKELNASKYRTKNAITDYNKQWFVQLAWQSADEAIEELYKKIRFYQYLINQINGQTSKEKITQSHIQAAKAVPISELLGGRVRRSGAGRLVARCIFHAEGQERTPSLVIYPDNTWHCFACQAHGDSIDFIIKRDNLKFTEAVKALCSLKN